MRRRLLNLTATTSLLLALAIAGLWAHSEFRALWCGHAGTRGPDGFTRQWEVGSTHGRLCWNLAWHWGTSSLDYEGSYVRSGPTEPIHWRWAPTANHYNYGPRGSQDLYHGAGFLFERSRATRVGWDRRLIAVPDWFLIAALLVPPARRWLKKKPAPGRCPACGYDLRATPQRCPECGAVPDAPPATVAPARGQPTA